MAASHEKLNALHDDYRSDPTPEKLHAVVQQLKPTVDYALSNLQAHGDPVMRTKAQILTAEAIKKFNPESGTALPTWVSHSLLPLRRFKRQSQTVTHVPERVQIEAYTLAKAEKEFVDQHGREADAHELADFSKLPIRRIATIRNTMKRTPSEGAIGDALPPIESDFSGEALDYVHQDSDHIDRRIIEMKTGYAGHEVHTPQEVARKLGLTPTQLSRRSTKISYRHQKFERMLQEAQS